MNPRPSTPPQQLSRSERRQAEKAAKNFVIEGKYDFLWFFCVPKRNYLPQMYLSCYFKAQVIFAVLSILIELMISIIQNMFFSVFIVIVVQGMMVYFCARAQVLSKEGEGCRAVDKIEWAGLYSLVINVVLGIYFFVASFFCMLIVLGLAWRETSASSTARYERGFLFMFYSFLYFVQFLFIAGQCLEYKRLKFALKVVFEDSSKYMVTSPYD